MTDLSKNVKAALSTPEGIAVADYLRDIVAGGVYDEEPMKMAYNEGRRMLALELLNHAHAAPIRVIRGGRA